MLKVVQDLYHQQYGVASSTLILIMLLTDIRIAVRSGLGRDGEGVRGFVELGEARLISVSDDDNRDD